MLDAYFEILFPRTRAGETSGPSGQTERAYEFLWKKIVRRELLPGERVLDAAIAREAGVSRTPVREAIQRLVKDGLLEQLPRGVRVARLAPDDVAHLYDYRIALETFATRQAASQVSEDTLLRMLDEHHTVRTQIEQGGRDNPNLLLECLRQDIALHQLILFSSGNPYVARAMASIHGQLSLFHAAGVTYVPEQIGSALADQQGLLSALIARDPDAAATAMERHLVRVKQRILLGAFGVAMLDVTATRR